MTRNLHVFTSLIVLFYHLSNIPNDDNSTTPYRVDTITDKIFNEHAPFFLFNHFRSKQIFPRFGTAYDNHRDPAVYLTCLFLTRPCYRCSCRQPGRLDDITLFDVVHLAPVIRATLATIYPNYTHYRIRSTD